MYDTIDEFTYDLPPDRIAQTPAVPRESGKLMHLQRNSGDIADHFVKDLPTFFQRGDILVINNTKVFHARLLAKKDNDPKVLELFLIKPIDTHTWQAIGKPGKKLLPKTDLHLGPDFKGTITEKHTDGTFFIQFSYDEQTVISKANQYGSVPIPPYIHTIPKDEDYQTIYAKHTGSVAAPTAGFHLTDTFFEAMHTIGVTVYEITLHVGLGTFMPIKTSHLSDHVMHSERVHVSQSVSDGIMQAKQEGRRVIAVGTTTVRTVEGIAALNNGKLLAYEGDVNLFIKPGFKFNIIDGMITNFHLPKSTLLVLVSAFAGRDHILQAYKHAVDTSYRFFSFGDAMLIL